MNKLHQASTRWLACCALALLGLTLTHEARADAREERRAARRAHKEEAATQPGALPTDFAPLPRKAELRHVRIPLTELTETADALRLSNRASESFSFAARSDQVLTAAELELALQAPQHVDDLTNLEVLLNGEVIQRFAPSELEAGGKRRLTLDPSLLASSNLLTLRLATARDAEGCGLVAPGSWLSLRKAALLLSSADLPMPDDLSVLPLPFFDAAFDRAQTLHFVLGKAPSSAQLQAANLVAGWFALQGKGRLSFAAHQGTLPAEHAVVFVSDAATAQALGLTLPEANIAASGLELRPHPAHPNLKLLVVWGLGAPGLTPAARELVRAGTGLKGALVATRSDARLPELSARQVPRVVAPGDVVLGHLPEKPALRVQGGLSETLRIPFRLAPDLFSWPKDHVDLDLGYAQSFSAKTGPASLHVALNGVSIGVLPTDRHGRSVLRIERELLRGFNELLLQVSYPERAPRPGRACDVDHDTTAWVELSADSRLALGKSERFAMLPDLGLFLYDGFPFSEHGDLRETTVVLPAAPLDGELSSMFGVVAHLANITGAAPTRLSVALGTPDTNSLQARDVLLVAASGRHPWLESYRARLPLVSGADGALAQYPVDSNKLDRYLAGHFDDAELARAQRVLDDKHYAAVMGVPTPWSLGRSLVIVTASEASAMPRFSELLGYASAERPHNDLLLRTEAGRAMFQLSTEQARGTLPWSLSLRWWLAHYWLLLLPILGLAALLWGAYARHKLSGIAAERLREADA